MLSSVTSSNNSPRSPEHTFVRSRFIVKRLKRMRSKTKSLTEDLNGSYSFHSNEPSSLPFIESLNQDDDEEYFQCCSESSQREDAVKDLVDLSLRNRSKVKEELVSFESESLHNLSRKTDSLTYASLVIDDDYNNSKLDIFEQETKYSDTSSNIDLSETNFKKRPAYYLLEEIEDALPKKYSLKRTLCSFYSVTMYRALIRLTRVLAQHRNDEVMCYSAQRKKGIEISCYYENEVKRLEIELAVQKMLLDQASKAMSVSTLKKYYQFEHIEAERAYLITSIKKEAAEKEIDRVKKMQVLEKKFDKESGFASIKKINICVEKPGTLSSYYFILVAVERDNVKTTELRKMCGENIEFPNTLQFHNLRHDFKINLYLYGISIKETRLKLFQRSTERLHLLSKKESQNKTLNGMHTSPPHSFILLGYTEIHLSHMQKKHFVLNSKSDNLCRSITLSINGDVYLEAQHSGFLDIRYLDERPTKQLTVWSRFWFRLTGSDLQGWPYPSEHTMKAPAHQIWLAQCTAEDAKPVNRFLCVRPNVFTFYLKDENGNGHQVLCAADSAEEVEDWCYQLNKVIEYCRKWNLS